MPTRSSTQKRRRSSSKRKPSANKWVRDARRYYRSNRWTKKNLLKKTGSLIARLLVLNQILDERYEKPRLTDSSVEDLKEVLRDLQKTRPDYRTDELFSDL